jgi:SAM-dependent methyltransferase
MHVLTRARELVADVLLRVVQPAGAHGSRPVGRVHLGDLRRTEPFSREFGYDRGLPVDRHYIEHFLERHVRDIRGRVLEVGGSEYTTRFGGAAVTRGDVLHVAAGNPSATIVGDLAAAPHIRDDSFDCIILTQTLQFIFDLGGAVATLHRIMAPGGTLLATVPGITQNDDDEWARTWYWSFTELSARRLLATRFPADAVDVEAWGNVLTSTAFLYGLAAEELRPAELAVRDPQYPMLITMRARKL